jgi:hypothetical protein
MAVDGALALDKQFGLLGFGVDNAVPAPTTPLVYRALDAEATQVQPEAAGPATALPTGYARPRQAARPLWCRRTGASTWCANERDKSFSGTS